MIMENFNMYPNIDKCMIPNGTFTPFCASCCPWVETDSYLIILSWNYKEPYIDKYSSHAINILHYLYWGCAFEQRAVLRRFRGLSGMASNPRACGSTTPLVSLQPAASDGMTLNFSRELGDKGRSCDSFSAASCAVAESIELRIVVASVSVDEARLGGAIYVN